MRNLQSVPGRSLAVSSCSLISVVHGEALDVPFDLPSGTDIALEHQVELDRFGHLIPSLRVDDLMFSYKLA